jgi:GT2 family glycosyltransferase
MNITVSIIIVNFNTAELLKNCIKSIKQKTLTVTYEIIVIDNNSSDNSTEMLKELYPDVLLISLKENVGFGKANNLGAKSARGNYLFFLNSDTYLINDAISMLVSFMESNPQCGISGGNITDFSGKPIHSFYKYLPSPFSDIFILFKKIPRLLYGKNWFYNFTDSPIKVAYITGADMMIGAELFSKLGGFDPEFFLYYEETELTNRIRKAGYYAYSIPGAAIAHKKGSSFQYLENANFLFYQSKYYYLKKVYGRYAVFTSHFIFSLVCFTKIFFYFIFNKQNSLKKYLVIKDIDSEIFHLFLDKKTI